MKLRLLVAFGGVSVEHEVSILSAMQAIAVLKEHYEILPLYISKNAVMYSDERLLTLESYRNLEELCAKLSPVSIVKEKAKALLVTQGRWYQRRKREFDMAVPILHGGGGEDGAFQGFLKTLDIPFVFSDVLGSALGQQKAVMKMVLQDRGLPIVPWFFWQEHQKREQTLFAKARRLGYPLIVKPAALGSSIGIRVAEREEELEDALAQAFLYDDTAVIERKIAPLREFNCSVLGNKRSAEASVVEEVHGSGAILSYTDKYEGGEKRKGMAGAKRRIPADISEEMKEEIQHYAKECFFALQAEGVCRIDFLMNVDTKELYINEINTIPGSLSFYLWEKSGVSFEALLNRLLLLGKERYRKEHGRIRSYDTNLLAEWKNEGKLKG